jgi:hypothetical protein
MDYRARLKLVWTVALVLLSITPGMAAAGWRILPTTGFVTDDIRLTLVNTIGALWLRSAQNGDRFRVYQGLPVNEGDVIDAVALCYRAEPGTSIDALGLLDFVVPDASVGTVRHVDTTDLNSSADTCYVSPVANYSPAGAVNLFLQLHFSFAGQGTIYVGVVAVHLK